MTEDLRVKPKKAAELVAEAQGTRLVDVQIARSIIEPPAAGVVAERQAPEDLLVPRRADEEANAVP